MSGDAFLAQQVEFLTAEVEEFKAREAALKKMNASLLEAMQQADHSNLRDHTLSELEKVTSQYTKELADLKARSQDEQLKAERTIRDLERRLKDIELDQKQAEVVHARERYELREVARQLEADKAMLVSKVKSLEEEKGQGRDAAKYEMELRLHAAQRELSIQKEEARTELLKAREAADKTVAELKAIFGKECETLKAHIAQLSTKCKKQQEKIQELREGSSVEDAYVQEVEKLQSELEALRAAQKAPRYPTQLEEERESLQHQVEELQFQLRQRDSPDKAQDALRRQNEELKEKLAACEESNSQLQDLLQEHSQDLSQTETLLMAKEREIEEKNAALNSMSRELEDSRNKGRGKRQCNLHWNTDLPFSTPKKGKAFCDTCSTLLRESAQDEDSMRREIISLERRVQELSMELEKTQLQRDRAKVDHDRALLELKHLQMEWAREEERRGEKELCLKNEVKYLIGKLLKAKGKHAAEAELNETMKKEATNRTLRPRSTARLRGSPMTRGISPLNLSVISRTESPFGASELDMY